MLASILITPLTIVNPVSQWRYCARPVTAALAYYVSFSSDHRPVFRRDAKGSTDLVILFVKSESKWLRCTEKVREISVG